MDNIRLFELYNTEDKCIELIKKWRDETGVHCKRCYGRQHTWISTRCRYRCKDCRWETTLRSGTALECSKLPTKYWVYAAILLSNGKKPISAKELQEQLGHKYYLPIWTLLHKLRVSMGLSSSLTGLATYIQYGEAIVPVVGRFEGDSGKSELVGVKGIEVCLEATQEQPAMDFRNSCGSIGFQTRFSAIRMKTSGIPMHSPTKRFAWLGVAESHHLVKSTDTPAIELIHKLDSKKKLSWMQTMAFNAWRNFLGIYHNVSKKYIQNYLCEFCFMTNRRHLGSVKFYSLMQLIVRQPWYEAQVQLSVYSDSVDIEQPLDPV